MGLNFNLDDDDDMVKEKPKKPLVKKEKPKINEIDKKPEKKITINTKKSKKKSTKKKTSKKKTSETRKKETFDKSKFELEIFSKFEEKLQNETSKLKQQFDLEKDNLKNEFNEMIKLIQLPSVPIVNLNSDEFLEYIRKKFELPSNKTDNDLRSHGLNKSKFNINEEKAIQQLFRMKNYINKWLSLIKEFLEKQ